jgi:uncharacterized protein (DUF302 family)
MIETTRYTLSIHLPDEPDVADPRVRTALAAEGFGILSEIDVRAALRDKLGEDIGAYTILGACNPPLARRAIAADADIGALLPCNVVVRAGAEGGTDVLAADPDAMLALSGAEELADIAADARQRVERALQSLLQPVKE